MNVKMFSALAVALVTGFAVAQDAEPASAETEVAEVAGQPAAAVKVFTVLPCCQSFSGVAEVQLPGSAEWAMIEDGKFYPLGASYRTKGAGSKLVVSFGPESKATIEGDASFGTKIQPLGGKSRTIVIGDGCLQLNLAPNLPEGSFCVVTAGFVVKNLAGDSKIAQKMKADGVESTVRCVTGTLAIEGRHYLIPQMHAADEICIRNTTDNLETFLYGTSGDYIVKLDRGIVTHTDVDDEGKVKSVSEKAVLDWHLSPKTKVRINRLVPAIGERMSVAIMTFDAVGELKNNFAYSEGRAEVNTGELVKAAKDNGVDAAAKKAAEAASDTTTSAPSKEENEESSEEQN